MSGSETMAWEGKQFNPREEEKFLDDKLMEIGLLEPGMTLQEKRELASFVLESTRMAKEQMNQREKEDKWEVMILSDDDDKDCAADTSKGKAYVDIASASSAVSKDKITRSKGKPENTNTHRELPHMIRDDEFERKKRGRENNDDTQKEEVEPLRTTAGEKKEREMVMKREKRDRQRKAEEEARRERQMKGKEERQQRERRKGDNRIRKEEVMKEDIEKSEVVEKPVDKTEELDTLDVDGKKEKGEIPKNSFYGPSHLIDAKSPNPFRKELYGSTSRCPPRNNSLLKLLEEDMKNKLAEASSKENEQSSKLFEKRVVGAKESVSSLDEDDFFFEGPCTSKGYGREKRNREVKNKGGDKESPAKDDKYDFFHKGEVAFSKNESKKGGCRAKKMLAIALSSQSGSVGKNQEDVTSCEKRRREEKSGLSTRSGMDKCERKEDDTYNGEVKTPNEKKRRLEKGQLTRRWSDVAAAKSSQVSQPEENDGADDSLKNKPKILLTPNKRWRRVKRNFKSAYGSGSEVDEWISSEEENKSEPKRLSKDQIVARIDNCLSRLKNALHNQKPCEVKEGNDKVRNHICANKKYKVPPGFQEPDSDDEWNLWKICFVDKPEAKGKLVKSEIKSDTPVSASNAVVTRSRARQRNSISPTLSSKSASSVEEDCGISSALPMLPLKEISPGPSNHSNDETQSSSKSPSMKEIALFNKVICPTSMISRSTQTPRDSDAGSGNSNSSSSASISPSAKSKEVTQESKPMWDLLEVDDELNGDKKEEVKMLEEVDLTATEESQPDPVICPICSRLFPMSEIEAHAAVCNAEEEDESSDRESIIEPKVGRENLRSQRMVSTAAGGSQENKIDMDEVEDFVGDNSHEEEDHFQPRPARLATFVPISQQKDSCIDYHDQFPELKNDSNLQASLARIRKKLMKAGTKKKGWRRRKKGRWKRVAKK